MNRSRIGHPFLVPLAAACLFLAGCVSFQAEAELPHDWQSAMQPSAGTIDLSGEYKFQGEGYMVPDSRIIAFFPFPKTIYLGNTFRVRQIDPGHIEVSVTEGSFTTGPFVFEIKPSPDAGRVVLPTFQKPWEEGGLPGITKVDVTFIKGRDGALYAKRTNYSAGSTLGIIVPTAAVISRWCRFLPVK